MAPPPAPGPRGVPTPLTAPSSRCISCSSNRWTCQWALLEHACQQASPGPEDGVVGAHMVRARGRRGPSCSAVARQILTTPPPQEDDCPQFLNPSPLVIPVNHETDVTFQGKNLDTVQVRVLRGPGLGVGLTPGLAPADWKPSPLGAQGPVCREGREVWEDGQRLDGPCAFKTRAASAAQEGAVRGPRRGPRYGRVFLGWGRPSGLGAVWCSGLQGPGRGGVGWPGRGVLTGLSGRAPHCLWAVTSSSLRRRSAPRSQEPSPFGPQRYASLSGWAGLVDPMEAASSLRGLMASPTEWIRV